MGWVQIRGERLEAGGKVGGWGRVLEGCRDRRAGAEISPGQEGWDLRMDALHGGCGRGSEGVRMAAEGLVQ